MFGVDPWPAWLLTRQSIDYLTGRRSETLMNLVGTPWTQPFGNATEQKVTLQVTGQADANSGTRLQVFPPDGSPPIPVESESGSSSSPNIANPRSGESAQWVTVTDTRSPGVYWIKGGSPGAGFSANLKDEMIDLQRVQRDALDSWMGDTPWTFATEPEQIVLTNQQSSQRISLTSPAMLLALLVFLLEQVLGNRFYRTK